MRLLHVIQRYYPYIGGSELYFQELSERFVEDGNLVRLFTTDAWDLEHFWLPGNRTIPAGRETNNGVDIERFPVEYLPEPGLAFPILRRTMALVARLPLDTTPLLFQMSRYAPRVPALERALEQYDAPLDLIHTANISLESLVYAAQRCAARRRVPFVVTPFTHLGTLDNPHVRRYYTMPHQLELLKRADAVIVMTPLESAELEKFGIAREKLHRIGVGVDPEKLRGGVGTRFRQKHGIQGPIVFYIGAAAFDKGTMQLVEAMKKVWADGTHSNRGAPTLVIAGPQLSQFEKYLEQQPSEARAQMRVLGFISEGEKRDLLDAGDVFAMPSRTDSFGIVYLEAWLYNKAVIGARAGGVPAVIADGQDGFLVDFGDVDALAARIQQLLDDPQLANKLGKAGNAKVLREMTWDKTFAQVNALYRSLCERGGPQRAA